MGKSQYHNDLLAEIAAFCGRYGMGVSMFGLAAIGDPNFYRDLENGRECKPSTVRRVRDYMASASDGGDNAR